MNSIVILAPNWLGDAVMALPAIADLRREMPDAAITVAARPAIAPLFQLVPGVRDTILLERRASFRDVGRWRAIGGELSGRGFDIALLLPNSLHAAIMASRADIPERWGYRTDLRGPLLTRAIQPTAGLHQVEYYQHLVHGLGFPSGPIEPRVEVSSDRREAGTRLLADAGWDGRTPLVALAPGAAYGGAKRWPPEYFAELAVMLASEGVQSVVIGSAADEPTAGEVARAFPLAESRGRQARVGTSDPKRVALLTLVGRTDIPTLAGVMAACRALVTNDSGAMHLGAAVGMPVTAVFGPTDEEASRPMGDAHVVATHPVWCRPCMLRECPIDHRCMRGVGVQRVFDAARKSL